MRARLWFSSFTMTYKPIVQIMVAVLFVWLCLLPPVEAQHIESYSYLWVQDPVPPTPTTLTWTLSYDAPINDMGAFAVYNGKLYASGSNGQSDGHVYVYDGISWTDMNFASQVATSVDLVQSLQVFGDRLYLGTRVNVGDAATVRVYYYDGVTFTEDFSANGAWGYSGIEDFAVHDGKLYASNGSPAGSVYQRNGDHDWITLGGVPEVGSAARGLASYNSELYVGTGTGGNQAKLWRWTGSSWTLVKNFATDYGINQDGAWSLATANGKLYVGLAGPGYPSPGFVYDGITWTTGLTIDGCNYARVAEAGGKIWAGSCGGRVFLLDGNGWASADIASSYGVFDFAEYNGAIFAATSGAGHIYRIQLASSCVAAPGGLISWWTGDGTTNDAADGNLGSLENGASYAAGKVGQAFNFDGIDDHVRIPSAANLNPAGSFSLEAWIYPTSDRDATIVSKWWGYGTSGGSAYLCAWHYGRTQGSVRHFGCCAPA